MTKRKSWLYRMPPVPRAGYHEFITPENSDLEYLTYGRLWVGPQTNYELSTHDHEVALVCLRGKGVLHIANQRWEMANHDLAYIPRDFSYNVKNICDAPLDIAVLSAPSNIDALPALVRFRTVEKDPKLHRTVGYENCIREVFTCLGPQIKACRLLIGFTWARPGNWTSWPPHEHGGRQEEIYLYYQIPEPGFAIQLVYSDPAQMEFIDIVRQDDVAIVPRGYHPNVVIPRFEMRYLWVICGRQPLKDREYGIWTYQRGYER